MSGGQTGADRAALDYALRWSISCGGWCPSGRLAEDGVIPQHYPLKETGSYNYADRTRRNVRDSDATLILHKGPLERGSLYTQRMSEQLNRPHLCLNMNDCKINDGAEQLVNFVKNCAESHFTFSLNVAGQRHSSCPEIYKFTYDILEACFFTLNGFFCLNFKDKS